MADSSTHDPEDDRAERPGGGGRSPGDRSGSLDAPTQAVPVVGVDAPTQAVPVVTADAPTQAVPVVTADAPTQAVPVVTADAPTQAVPVVTADAPTESVAADPPVRPADPPDKAGVPVDPAPLTRTDAPTRAAPVRVGPVRIDPVVRLPAAPAGAGPGGLDLRRLLLAAAVLLLLLGGVVTALSVRGPVLAAPEIVAPSPPRVSLSYQPQDGVPVGPTTPVRVTADGGELREVTLTAPGYPPVKGELSADRRAWTAAEPLAYGKTYAWAGVAADADGKTVPLAGTVAVVKPVKLVRGTINIGDGRVVGIAAPIEIQFSGKITDRAAAERAMKIDTSVPTEGAWAWLPDEAGGSRVHWRPRVYWKPGTKVVVSAPLYGVDYGRGSWGASNMTSTFAIGRAQVVKADVDSHQLVVTRDGREVARYDASYGLDSDPNRNTRSGIHVVTEKFTDKRMVSQQYGYDVMEKWAVRMSNNGEFIHANPATTGVQGSRNVSHGCVNLSTADAKAYYDSAIYGDPVEVTGSVVQLSARDGDIWDWTLSWDQWQRLSALEGS